MGAPPEQAQGRQVAEPDERGYALTAQDESILFAACVRSWHRALTTFVIVALETGARFSTIKRMQWLKLDFVRRSWTVTKDKTRNGTGRTIPLTQRAFETLRFWAELFPERKPSDFVFPWERYSGPGAEQIFGASETSRQTDVTRPTDNIKKAWERAREHTRRICPECRTGWLTEKQGSGFLCADCGRTLPELPQGLRHVRFHDLRHTKITRMITDRVPLPMIAKIVGWSPSTLAKMTLRYGHFSLEEMRSAMESPNREIALESPKKSPKSDHSGKDSLQ